MGSFVENAWPKECPSPLWHYRNIKASKLGTTSSFDVVQIQIRCQYPDTLLVVNIVTNVVMMVLKRKKKISVIRFVSFGMKYEKKVHA